LIKCVIEKYHTLVDTIGTIQNNQEEEQEDSRSSFMCILMDVPLWILENLVALTAGLLYRGYFLRFTNHEHPITFDLTPYGDLAMIQALAPEEEEEEDKEQQHKEYQRITTSSLFKKKKSFFLPLLVRFHLDLIQILTIRCPREPRWQCARGDLLMNPLYSASTMSPDPKEALKGYLVAASLATNFFSENTTTSIIEIFDQSSLVRMVSDE
jgi:hypothetical protein